MQAKPSRPARLRRPIILILPCHLGPPLARLLFCPVLSADLSLLSASPMAAARPVVASREASEAPRRSSTKVATTKHLKWTDIEGWRKDNHYIQTGKL